MRSAIRPRSRTCSSPKRPSSVEPTWATPITRPSIAIGIATSETIPRRRRCGLASSICREVVGSSAAAPRPRRGRPSPFRTGSERRARSRGRSPWRRERQILPLVVEQEDRGGLGLDEPQHLPSISSSRSPAARWASAAVLTVSSLRTISAVCSASERACCSRARSSSRSCSASRTRRDVPEEIQRVQDVASWIVHGIACTVAQRSAPLAPSLKRSSRSTGPRRAARRGRADPRSRAPRQSSPRRSKLPTIADTGIASRSAGDETPISLAAASFA